MVDKYNPKDWNGLYTTKKEFIIPTSQIVIDLWNKAIKEYFELNKKNGK